MDCALSQIETEISKRGLLQSVGYDGGGREFRTNPISIRSLKQVRGFKYISEYYTVIREHTRVVKSGGTHIHISILGTDHPNLEVNATAMGIAFFNQFQKISGRKTNWAYRLEMRTLQEVRDMLARYKMPNQRTYSRLSSMLNPTRYQTLELRGPKGSNDKEEVLAWIEFAENIAKVANRRSIEGIPFSKLLKGKRISAYVDALPKNRKLTEAELNQKFVGSALYA